MDATSVIKCRCNLLNVRERGAARKAEFLLSIRKELVMKKLALALAVGLTAVWTQGAATMIDRTWWGQSPLG